LTTRTKLAVAQKALDRIAGLKVLTKSAIIEHLEDNLGVSGEDAKKVAGKCLAEIRALNDSTKEKLKDARGDEGEEEYVWQEYINQAGNDFREVLIREDIKFEDW